jgi:hypothetical protein
LRRTSEYVRSQVYCLIWGTGRFCDMKMPGSKVDPGIFDNKKTATISF